MSKHSFAAVAMLLLLTAAAVSVSAQTASIRPEAPIGKGIVVIKAARLIDGTGKTEITNAVLVVTDDRVTAVGQAGQVKVPSGAKVIGRILGDPEGPAADVKDYASFAAILGTRNAENLLLAGFTTIRNVGAPN